MKKDKIFDFNSLSENLVLLTKLPNYAAEGIYQFYSMWNSEERILKTYTMITLILKVFITN